MRSSSTKQHILFWVLLVLGATVGQCLFIAFGALYCIGASFFLAGMATYTITSWMTGDRYFKLIWLIYLVIFPIILALMMPFVPIVWIIGVIILLYFNILMIVLSIARLVLT